MNKSRPSLNMETINNFLDRKILPWPVRFLTFRFVILLTIALLIPLIVWASNTVMVLAINSYLNTMSVAVSSIVLLYATISEARQNQIAELQEKRAQEDHAHVTEMHTLVLKSLQAQQEEIQELKQLVSLMSGKEYMPEKPEPLPDLRVLHPRGDARYQNDEFHKRWQKQIHHNPLLSTLHKNLGVKKNGEPNGEQNHSK
jgi:hypothetical protein